MAPITMATVLDDEVTDEGGGGEPPKTVGQRLRALEKGQHEIRRDLRKWMRVSLAVLALNFLAGGISPERAAKLVKLVGLVGGAP